MAKLIKISELSKQLNLIDPSTKKPQNYVLRFWEKEFKQIKPKIINRQRYYSKEQVETIIFIKFLLKNKGLTINGVKKVLNSNINKLDDYDSDSLKTDYYKTKLKEKTKNLLTKLKELKKKHGKKNSY